MNKTPNYQLNQWDKSDRIRMEDFNADNAKIEEALSNAGNCKIAMGSYVGTGKSGADYPNEITADFYPLMVFLDVPNTNYYMAFRSSDTGFIYSSTYKNALTWSNRGLSWHSSAINHNAAAQFNTEGQTYHYLVIGV